MHLEYWSLLLKQCQSPRDGHNTVFCKEDRRLYSRLLCSFFAGGAFCFFAVRFLTGLSPLTWLGATSDLNEILHRKFRYGQLPLHHSPGFWLVVPGKRNPASSGNCVTLTAGNHHPDIRRQGQVLVSQ